MKPLLPRAVHLQTLAAALVNVEFVAAALSESDVPASLVSWLRQLALLKGVPFGYLVPHEAMLPPESIRFFTVDPSWIDALLEGACSIGRASSASEKQDAAVIAKLFAAAQLPPAVTGFVLRSAVVSGWPGLEVTAYDQAGNVLPSPPLRMERLAPTVLLFLCAGVIDRVDIHEPPEGLHFGTGQDGKIVARYITVPAGTAGKSPGDEVLKNQQPVEVGVTFRDDDPDNGRRVVRVAALADSIKNALHDCQANNNTDGSPRLFTSAEFAVEMIEGVQLVQFRNQHGKGGG
jgi:hypothetical protein